jgi:hypothetical protein
MTASMTEWPQAADPIGVRSRASSARAVAGRNNDTVEVVR